MPDVDVAVVSMLPLYLVRPGQRLASVLHNKQILSPRRQTCSTIQHDGYQRRYVQDHNDEVYAVDTVKRRGKNI